MSTVFPTKQGIERNWHVIDANDVVLGKLASHAARLLMGKHKTTWTPFIDTGDHVIVINAEKVKLTGNKDIQKVYRSFSGYPGGLIETSAQKVRAKRPARMVEEAISGMLPKTKLGKQMYRKLKVYAGDKHPHAAQKPAPLKVNVRLRLLPLKKGITFGNKENRTISGNWPAQAQHRPCVPAAGPGKITINGRDIREYFPTEAGRMPVRKPLLTVEMADRFDMLVLAEWRRNRGTVGRDPAWNCARAGRVQR